MDYEVKREVSLLSERLRQRILEHVEEEIEEAWHVKLHPVEAKKESQQTLEVDEEMPSPGLSEMSESLSSVSLGAPAPATPMPRTRQERRDSPALALNDRARRTRTSERLAERMHVIDEDPKDKLNAMNSNDRKQLKRKHEGFLDQAEEATSAKKPKSKKLRLV